MCGICGFTGKPENRGDVIRRMTEVITHRGPDSDGFFSDDYIAMGFRRLSIIDLEAGSQPIFNEDKTMVLTFNGEIYNYRQLRQELTEKGHQFATDSDSEVLIHGFEEWKEDLLPRLRGMFAFAIYNTADQSLFMARDFFGIKPLHYTQIGNDFVYASEIKSILEHPDFEKRFNTRALDSYLSFQYAVPPETFFEDVYCLLPGHYLWYQNGYIETERYFDPRFRPKENMTEEEAVNKIEKVFENSVNAHKIADVEVGCFLSSGVDSSYVSSYFSGQKTFTVGFDFGEKYNEISWAESVSKLIDTEHHTHLISGEEFWDAVPTVQYYMDQPLADPSCVALYFVSRLASQYVKVVLSGEGADELFGGYTCYNDPRVFKTYQKLTPHVFRKGARSIARKLPDVKGRDYVIRACDKLEDRYIGNAFMYDLKEKQQLLKNPSIATAPQRLTRRHYYRSRRYDDVTKMQYLDLNMWMTGDILLKADRMSMANSLELRVPFLDKEVYKVAASLPTHLRVNKSNTKYALRKAAARHLPEATAEKEKLGFPVPTRVWLRDEKYYNIVKETFQSETAEKFFNTDVLVAWLDEHFSGKEDNSRRVWTVYVFLIWYNIYFNEATEKAEKPVNHLDELKKAADLKRENKRRAAEAPAENAAETGSEAPGAEEADAPAQQPDAEETPKSMLDLIPSLNDIPVPALHKPPADDEGADAAEDTADTEDELAAANGSDLPEDAFPVTDDAEAEEKTLSEADDFEQPEEETDDEPLSADDLAEIFGEPLALESEATDDVPANFVPETWEDAFEAPVPETEEEPDADDTENTGGETDEPAEETGSEAPEVPDEETVGEEPDTPDEEAVTAAPDEPEEAVGESAGSDNETDAPAFDSGDTDGDDSEWDDDDDAFDEWDDDEFDEYDDDEFDEDDDDEFDEDDDDEFDEDDELDEWDDEDTFEEDDAEEDDERDDDEGEKTDDAAPEPAAVPEPVPGLPVMPDATPLNDEPSANDGADANGDRSPEPDQKDETDGADNSGDEENKDDDFDDSNGEEEENDSDDSGDEEDEDNDSDDSGNEEDEDDEFDDSDEEEEEDDDFDDFGDEEDEDDEFDDFGEEEEDDEFDDFDEEEEDDDFDDSDDEEKDDDDFDDSDDEEEEDDNGFDDSDDEEEEDDNGFDDSGDEEDEDDSIDDSDNGEENWEDEEPIDPEEAWKHEDIVPEIYEEDGEEFIDISVFSTVEREKKKQAETETAKKSEKRSRRFRSPFGGKAKAKPQPASSGEDTDSDALTAGAAAPDEAEQAAPPVTEAAATDAATEPEPVDGHEETAVSDEKPEENAAAPDEPGEDTGEISEDAADATENGSDDLPDDEFDDESDDEFDEE